MKHITKNQTTGHLPCRRHATSQAKPQPAITFFQELLLMFFRIPAADRAAFESARLPLKRRDRLQVLLAHLFGQVRNIRPSCLRIQSTHAARSE